MPGAAGRRSAWLSSAGSPCCDTPGMWSPWAGPPRQARKPELMSVADVIGSGPLLLAIPVAAAAGAVTFLSPCCLPLVPGYLSYVTGMSGAAAEQGGDGRAAPARATKARTVAGTLLFVLGFSAVFAAYGTVLGGLGSLLSDHNEVLTQILGGLTILLGLLFAGAFDRFTFAGRIFKPSARPRAGLAGGPPPRALSSRGWGACIVAPLSSPPPAP